MSVPGQHEDAMTMQMPGMGGLATIDDCHLDEVSVPNPLHGYGGKRAAVDRVGVRRTAVDECETPIEDQCESPVEASVRVKWSGCRCAVGEQVQHGPTGRVAVLARHGSAGRPQCQTGRAVVA